MGTDIHLFVEKLNKEKGVWENQPAPLAYPEKVTENPEIYGDWYSWYPGRNYDTFAILADVRNGSGFAGCDTGDGFNPISMPKGMPKNVSLEVLKEFAFPIWATDEEAEQKKTIYYETDQEDCRGYSPSQANEWKGKYECEEFVMGDGTHLLSSPDWHSASWHTLKDLLDYDWEQTTNKRGVIDENQYKAWKEKGGGQPESYCGGMSGWSTKTIFNGEMDKIISGKQERELAYPSRTSTLTEPKPYRYCTQVQWTTTYKETSPWFCNVFLERLKDLADGDPSSVRIVFWFDC